MIRIIVGVLFLSNSIYYLLDFHFFYGSYNPVFHHSVFEKISSVGFFLETAVLVFFGICFSSVGFILGLKTKFFNFLLLLSIFVLSKLMMGIHWGWFKAANTFLWIFLFLPLDEKLSLNANYEENKIQSSKVIFILKIQVFMTYMVSSVGRLFQEQWQNGEEVFRLLVNTLLTRIPVSPEVLIEYSALLQIFEYLAMAIEFLSPFFIFLYPCKIRDFFLYLLVFVHLYLLITTTILWWQILMIGVLFLFIFEERVENK